MANSRKLWVFCYDITDDGIRRRIARLLEKRATRVQASVFEMRGTREEAHRFAYRLARLTLNGDSLRVYPLSQTALDCSLVFGPAPLAEKGDYWIV